MTDARIIQAFDSINPSEEAKQRIMTGIFAAASCPPENPLSESLAGFQLAGEPQSDVTNDELIRNIDDKISSVRPRRHSPVKLFSRIAIPIAACLALLVTLNLGIVPIIYNSLTEPTGKVNQVSAESPTAGGEGLGSALVESATGEKSVDAVASISESQPEVAFTEAPSLANAIAPGDAHSQYPQLMLVISLLVSLPVIALTAIVMIVIIRSRSKKNT